MKKRMALLWLCGPVLTACPVSPPLPFNPPTTFDFTLPSPVNDANARVAAIAYLYESGKAEPTVKSVGYGTVYAATASLYVTNSDLDALAKDARCFGPFKGGQDTRDLDPASLVVTPANVNTCQVFFVLYSDANRDGTPEQEELIYDTHDQFVYADQDFSYSGQDGTHTATEQGTRTRGWSLVRHSVIEPSATPGHFQVTMNSEAAPSVNGAAGAYQVRLHEPSNFFASMSVGSRR